MISSDMGNEKRKNGRGQRGAPKQKVRLPGGEAGGKKRRSVTGPAAGRDSGKGETAAGAGLRQGRDCGKKGVASWRGVTAAEDG